jgi:hypothetical protein
MTEPIKLPPLPVILIHLGYGWMAEDYARLAVEQATAELRAELATAEYALRSKGYRKSCDIPACNCGDQWSHGGNAEARLRELSSELDGSPVDMNGKTLLAGLSELVERTEKAEAEVERLRAALEYAVSQNEHDMLLTGDECRAARAALKEPK